MSTDAKEELGINTNGHASNAAEPGTLDLPPMPAEPAGGAASGQPPLPEEPEGSGAAGAEEAGPPLPDEPPADEEEAGPSSSVQAWPEEENAMSPEEEERLLKVWSLPA